ncbi:hypothetical protein EON66_06690 [archaeon]|nr:MAG: hypothetical protein EON66_06690 [archaeon]
MSCGGGRSNACLHVRSRSKALQLYWRHRPENGGVQRAYELLRDIAESGTGRRELLNNYALLGRTLDANKSVYCGCYAMLLLLLLLLKYRGA